jgi:hypothetical protein
MDLRDVAYYVKRKQGSPKLTDQGVADIFLGGSGFSFKIKMSTSEKSDRQNFFKVDKVDVDVKNFNIKLKQSKHKLLFGIAKPLMLKVIRPPLQKALEKQIKDQVRELDSLFWKVKQEADRAQKQVSTIQLLLTLTKILMISRLLRIQARLPTSINDMSPPLRSNLCKGKTKPKPLLKTRRSTWL